MILSDQWQPYTGDYEKEYHAIKTKDGREFTSAWPNAGVFFCEVKGKSIPVNEEAVAEVKKGIHPLDLETW